MNISLFNFATINQVTIVVRSLILPIALGFFDESLLSQYIDFISVSFIFAAFFSFGIPQALGNRLLKEGKINTGYFLVYVFPSLCFMIFLQFIKIVDISPIFYIYYFLLSFQTISAGSYRRSGKYMYFLREQAIINVFDATLIFYFSYIHSDIGTGVLIAGLIRLYYLPSIFSRLSIENSDNGNAFFKISFGLFLGSFANTFFNIGSVFILNTFASEGVAEYFFILRLFFRPTTIIIRIFSDMVLSQVKNANFTDALSVIRDTFDAKLLLFIYIISVSVLSSSTFALFKGWQSAWYVIILFALDCYFVLKKNPYEITFLSFENHMFRPVQYFMCSLAGLPILLLSILGFDLVLLMCISPLLSSTVTYVLVRRLAK